MPYRNTYAILLARTVDIMLSGWIWREYGVTISSMAGLELRKPQPARWARILGAILNRIQAGHCESAIQDDLYRARRVIDLLEHP